MTFLSIIEECTERAVKRERERGLPICVSAESIMKNETSYTSVSNSIWQNVDDTNEYVICLCTSNYMDGGQRDPQSWGWKVPGILHLHLASKKSNQECSEIAFGKIPDTYFYLFKIQFTQNNLEEIN